MRQTIRLSVCGLAAFCLIVLLGSLGCYGLSRPVAVPIRVEQNRVFVAVDFVRTDKTVRPALLWIDSGNPDFELSEELADDIGLSYDRSKLIPGRENNEVAATMPSARIGRLSLNFEDTRPMVVLGKSPLYPGMDVEGNLPSTVLKHYDVVLDGPAKKMWIGSPGSLAHRGRRIPVSVQPSTGMVQTQIKVAGKTYSIALDNGAAYSIFSRDVIDGWELNHPGWPHSTGAVGAANMFGFPFESDAVIVRVRQVEVAETGLSAVGVFAMPYGMFDWYSQKTSVPVRGLLGGNVLAHLRFEIDYANSSVYLADNRMDPHDLDVVGITLSPRADGFFDVIGIAKRDGIPLADGIEKRDRLLSVNGTSVHGFTLSGVLKLLRGKPGQTKVLLLERNGKRMVVATKVVRCL